MNSTKQRLIIVDRFQRHGSLAGEKRLTQRRTYYVYIMASQSGVLYTGITNNLVRRIHEHKTGAIPGFTRTHRTSRLVYFEGTSDVAAATGREKQIKGWLRRRKIALMDSRNPRWEDLSDGWYDEDARRDSSGEAPSE